MRLTFLLLSLLLLACAPVKPYQCGPVLSLKTVNETFTPLLSFINIKPGETFADVGASSGYYTVMMTTLLTNNTVYVQDIDTTCLNSREFNKVIDFYSKKSGIDLRKRNDLRYAVGKPDATNLPENFFDHIYTNGTFHHFSDPDKMAKDFYRKLKATGDITIRDSFYSKEEEYCGTSHVRLQPMDTLLAVMDRNGFRLLDQKDFKPYPTLRFGKK